MIKVKRVYEPSARTDGARFLVDHLWPRGRKKEEVPIARWAKEAAPSSELRAWFGHDPAKWKEFHRRYFTELDDKPDVWEPLLEAARKGTITLLFAARDTEHNNAVVLKDYLEQRLRPEDRPSRSGRVHAKPQ